MLRLIKLLKWDLQNKTKRFYYIFFLMRNFPGEFGFYLRQRYLAGHLKACGNNLKVHEGVRIRNPHQLSLGHYVNIGVNNILQAAGEITIGNDVLLGPDVKIWSTNHVFADSHKPVRDQGYEFKPVVIGNNVWIGSNVFIMPGAVIGDGCIISAGSVVGAKILPEYSIVAGNPARKIGSRL